MRNTIYILLLAVSINSTTFAQDKIIYSNDKDGFVIYDTKALYNGIEVYNSKKEELKFRAKEKGSDTCPTRVDVYSNPLSLVGSYFSYEHFFGEASACGGYANQIKVETVDLKTMKKVSLTDLFTEESILKAFKNDSWLLKRLETSKVKLDSIKSFNKMLTLLNKFSIDIKFNAYNFTVIDKKMKDGKIGIRFVGSQPVSVGYHRKHLQLGLWLVPKKVFKKQFLNNTKFVLGDFKNGLTE